MRFLDVFIRQAHPGECRGSYRSFAQKAEAAKEYKLLEGIPWPVLVDDLAGYVHRSYGGLSNPVYLIDAEGRVAFYGMLTHAPTLRRAIDELLARNGRGGPVAGGIDRFPHLFAAFVNGWRGLKRGCWQAALDTELALPGAASLTYLGSLLRPVLAPFALRTSPLPSGTQIGLVTALLGSVALTTSLLVMLARRLR